MTANTDNADRLGDFLAAYEEYLDGKRAYEDLPAAIYGNPPDGWDQVVRRPSSRRERFPASATCGAPGAAPCAPAPGR